MADVVLERGSGAVVIQGTEALRAALGALGARAAQAAARALFQAGERIMAEAKDQTPVDTGALRASGHVELPEVAAGQVTVTLGFGNSSVGYAVFVHENLAARHPVGKAKFLEDPVLQWAATAESQLAAALQAALG